MAQYKTPGVYIEEESSFGSSIVHNETAVPVFIGFTEKAIMSNKEPIGKVEGSAIVCEPYLVQSLLEYEQLFGGADTTGYIQVESGSEPNSFTAENQKDGKPYTPGFLYPSVANYLANGGGGCYIVSLGTYNDFDHTVKADDITAEMPNLEAAIEQAETATLLLPTDLVRFGTEAYYSWGTHFINYSETTKKLFTVMDVVQQDPTSSVFDASDITVYREAVKPNWPSYGAAYFPYLASLTPYTYQDDLSNVYLNGEPVKERDPEEEVKSFLSTNYINLPSSPFMAGIYSRLDNATGVWTPPANVAPTGVSGPVVPLTNQQQEDLNVDATAGISVNAIRSFTGRGTLVWGARTNDGNSQDWRYVNVRRLFISMETDIAKALEAFVFKPNVHNTWVEVKTMIESYLRGLYNQGAFAGTTPEGSYQVLIGIGETMTDQDVLDGYMRVSIQVAPVRPAEFIVLTFLQMVEQ